MKELILCAILLPGKVFFKQVTNLKKMRLKTVSILRDRDRLNLNLEHYTQLILKGNTETSFSPSKSKFIQTLIKKLSTSVPTDYVRTTTTSNKKTKQKNPLCCYYSSCLSFCNVSDNCCSHNKLNILDLVINVSL